MFIATRHVPADPPAFLAEVTELLEGLRECDGFVRGVAGTATDDGRVVAIVLEWADIGSYRRGIGRFDLRPLVACTLATAVDADSSFESIIIADSSGMTTRGADRSPDAHISGPLRGS